MNTPTSFSNIAAAKSIKDVLTIAMVSEVGDLDLLLRECRNAEDTRENREMLAFLQAARNRINDFKELEWSAERHERAIVYLGSRNRSDIVKVIETINLNVKDGHGDRLYPGSSFLNIKLDAKEATIDDLEVLISYDREIQSQSGRKDLVHFDGEDGTTFAMLVADVLRTHW